MQSSEDDINEEMWPTLNEAHGVSKEPEPSDDWEIVRQDDDDGAIEIQVLPPEKRKLRHCASSPDLRFIGRALEAVDEEDEDGITLDSQAESSAVLVDTVQPWRSSTVKLTSFRDVILAQKATEQEQKEPVEEVKPRPKPKIKPKIVVTPIRRCSKSTGDLRSLVIDEDEVLGDTDAMEYYHRKAHGHAGRKNSLKERPDEAKRRIMTVNKKNMQRQQQAASRG